MEALRIAGRQAEAQAGVKPAQNAGGGGSSRAGKRCDNDPGTHGGSRW